jgi:putative membrane protein
VSTLFAFLHHAAAFTLVSAIAVEFTLMRLDFTIANARRLLIADAVLGLSAGLLLVVGLLRVFYFEKGAAYYFSSHAFLTKLSVFVAVVLMSLVPTFEFLSWRKALKAQQLPAANESKMVVIGAILGGELIAVSIILLCAAVTARGDWV